MRKLISRALAMALLAVAAHATAADIVLPSVAVGGTIRAQFTLTAGGKPLAGIAVTLTPLNGCGTIGGAASTVVTTDSSGTARFDLTVSSQVGYCRIEGRNGDTVAYAGTMVYSPADVVVTDTSVYKQRVYTVPTSVIGAVLQAVATARDATGKPVALNAVPVGVSVTPDDNGASATGIHAGSTIATSAPSMTNTDGTFVILMDTNAIPGIYDLAVSVGGTATRTLRVVQSGPSNVSLATFTTATGTPLPLDPMTVSIVSGASGCLLYSPAFIRWPTPGLPSNVPAGTAGFLGNGMVNVGFFNCSQPMQLRFDFPHDLPPGVGVFRSAGAANGAWQWVPQPVNVNGKSATITINPATLGGSLSVGFAVPGTPASSSSVPRVKDLWWSGLEENGWGMSIMQSDDGSNVFPVIFGYDDRGNPSWWAMGGWWDMDYRHFFLDVVQPRGTPWHAFDEGLEVLVVVRGKAELTFADPDHATFDYVIDGRTGVKSLVRQPFGVSSSATIPPVGGMWWGGSSQAGWGIAVAQQQGTLFAVWYSYDDRGYPTWLVMPGGQWTAANTYEGRVYRTHSSAWLGRTYDRSQFVVTDVGSYRFTFNGTTGTFAYVVDGRSGSIAISRQAPF